MSTTSLDELIHVLTRVEHRALEAQKRLAGAIDAVHPDWEASARNLVDYVAMRQVDVRDTQKRLADLGLSSLGRSEAHVRASLKSVLQAVCSLAGTRYEPPAAPARGVSFAEGAALLARHAHALLGAPPAERAVRIMVTLPSEAAHDERLTRDLVERGMNCARINAAHDGPDEWRAMCRHVRQASRELGRECHVEIDLPGPKLRTGALEAGPRVVKWKPKRDELGHVASPARVWLTPAESPMPPPEARPTIRLPRRWLRSLEKGMHVSLVDLRGRERALIAVSSIGDSWWAESDRTAYVGPATEFVIHPHDGAPRTARPHDLAAIEKGITLHVGDRLRVTRAPTPGRDATSDAKGQITHPAHLPCTLVEALDGVEPGHAIWFDDGKVGGMVEAVDADGLTVRVTHALPTGSVVKADKGINLPDSPLRIPALADRDLEALAVAAEEADSVALSFARSAKDVEALQQALENVSKRTLGIVLKIETRRGFEQLPGMLLAAMRTPPVGVMIARGDLAVECGYERLAEVQEELLWVCEAAHVPVIWATQVLESLAKHGLPSRAEITDAAMGERAECVMLNKGPFIHEAVRVLDDILRRMQAHQSKKTAMMRPLRSLAFE